MRTLAFSLRAEQDLLGIYRIIAKDKPVAALEYVTTIRDKLILLREYPEMGREVGGARLWPALPRVVVKYRVRPRFIDIIRVAYAGQRL